MERVSPEQKGHETDGLFEGYYTPPSDNPRTGGGRR
jgi:hypothetical protein